MAEEPARPGPDALLVEAAREGRGRLKVFLGAAPGVGKTFAMLEEARRLKAEGIDVVVALVETHGRTETEALLAGLEVMPRRLVGYRDRTFSEMDVDAVLARRPRLAIVDELAHTNVPGSRHPKRAQDVEELLDAGIDVYSALNIQHLESLNDIVARISGVRVRETVPDGVLELADEVELIDLPTDELIQRLRQGKVYVHDQIARAIQNFFSKGNLTALRELAMRVAADRVDAQMTQHMRSHAIAGPWPTQEKILVCINESPVAKSLVRAAKRMAERARIGWIVANVVTPHRESLPDAAKDRIVEALRLGESLGAEVVTLTAGADVAREILDFARQRNVSRLVVGRPRPRRLLAFLSRETVAEELVRRAVDFEVTLVASDPREGARAPIRGPRLLPERNLAAYGWAAVAVAVATGVAMAIDAVLPVSSLSPVFLVAVLLVATRLGLWPSLFASLASFAVYNFFFTEPLFTLLVSSRDDVLALLLFLAAALFSGNLAGRLRAQVTAQRAVSKRINNLYEFSRKIASAASLEDVVWAAVHHVASTLQCRALVLAPGEGGGHLAIIGGYPPEDQLDAKDRGAAEWAWEHGEPAGWGSDTLPTSAWLFLPLKTGQGAVGLLGVAFDGRALLSPDERRLLEALVDQVALAVERTRLVADLGETRFLSETERLRQALLSSVSHDLRTPLVSIIGAASTLIESDAALGPEGRRQMAEAIREEGERLNRFVQNLLDMTRLGYGALRLNLDWVDLREVMGRATRQLGPVLRDHPVDIAVPASLGPIHIDAILMEQVMANLLDNAAKYAPAGTPITVAARRDGREVVIETSDAGPGIPPEDRERVFDMFYRVRAGDGQRAGTGLGLAICRGIVEAHGGRIKVGDAAGGGARIEIRLPSAGEPPTPPAPEETP
ncbi:two-component system sensor histidine kinase KdpD [Stella humosa]|uniref:histidine kinase n=1 Tax=Stella humosa TaxID=94 RepID=A0A3N1M829_9PROT|nr:sensor histidine kinase KdpD [Stella humosa]ROP99840.1 two-component system sensor histidine kinase KdpD [Stella humosa]BBK30932.1 two-component sensor histidine kinase [Stella humosa]